MALTWLSLPLAWSAPPLAPDAAGFGPYTARHAEYRLPPALDPQVLPNRITEIWGEFYWPKQAPPAPLPLVVFLHGNHPTCGIWQGTAYRQPGSCQYASTGTCGPGEVVIPSHRGFDYLANQLASWGYFVVSVNSNRGINCMESPEDDEGLVQARARLVLKHLAYLSHWNRGDAPTPADFGIDLRGRIDFQQVGLLGHSRGGEAMRAVPTLYRDPGSIWPGVIPDPLRVRAVFEIAGMDSRYTRLFNVDGLAWAQILPACDDDNALLLGVRPFDRAMNIHRESSPQLKSLLYVWGANHNYFNTEWHVADGFGCFGHAPLFPIDQPSLNGSPAQRQIASSAVLALFRANLGANADVRFNQLFDPRYAIPPALSALTKIERAYLSTPDTRYHPVLENFQGPPGFNLYGPAHVHENVTVSYGRVPQYWSELEAGIIGWETPGENVYFQTEWAEPGGGIDMRSGGYISFRISRAAVNAPSGEPLDIGIRLVDAGGHLSSERRIGDFAQVLDPVGGYGWPHPVLNTVMIPLEFFGSISLKRVRGLRFIFNGTTAGTIHLDELRFHLAPLAAKNPAAALQITDERLR
ncbi:MAG: hypothetical protein AB7F66_01095 [Bacteriovoracia bacterium]